MNITAEFFDKFIKEHPEIAKNQSKEDKALQVYLSNSERCEHCVYVRFETDEDLPYIMRVCNYGRSSGLKEDRNEDMYLFSGNYAYCPDECPIFKCKTEAKKEIYERLLLKTFKEGEKQ